VESAYCILLNDKRRLEVLENFMIIGRKNPGKNGEHEYSKEREKVCEN